MWHGNRSLCTGTPERPTSRARLVLLLVATMVIGAGIAVMPNTVPVVAATTGYRALAAPQRLLDTRPGESTADGDFAGIGIRSAGSTLTLKIAGRAGLPSDMSAVVLNVTVTAPAAPGYITVYPCDRERPTASNVNYSANQTVPNAVIATLDGAGRVCLFTLQRTHLVVDASGAFPISAFDPLPEPRRLLDTRPGESTADGKFAGTGIRSPGTVFKLPVAGRAGVPKVAGAVALNVTVTGADGPGFVTVFPCGAPQPVASNLNYVAGQTVANLVISSIGDGGNVCLFVRTTAHLVVDVSGMLPTATFRPLAAPQRLLDTRPGAATADGKFHGSGTQPARGTLQLRTAGRVGLPADASAVVLNVTAVTPSVPGYVTVHPRGSKVPTASNVNYAPGEVVANAVIARVGRNGELCVFTSGSTDLVIDVAGWLTGPAPATAGGQCPSLTPTDTTAREQLVARPTLHGTIGTDRIAVLVCDASDATFLPPGVESGPSLDAAEIAKWANKKVAPWFTSVSRGAYTPVFQAHPDGSFKAGNLGDCIFDGPGRTGAPFTNVIVFDTTTYGGGQAGPGRIGPSWAAQFDVSALSRPPSASGRGAWVGGAAAFYDPSVVIHEIGHTLHWPHSYIEPSDEYDNPLDVMSGQPDALDLFGDGGLVPDLSQYCPGPTGGYIWCKAQNTLAFNRLASGWITGKQVAIHRSGHVNYTLDRPSGNGVQLVALPDPNAPLRMMTLEARPATGYDDTLVVPGVAVHLIDQGSGDFNGISTNRRQRQAIGKPYSYDHVIEPGSNLTIGGVTIQVLGAAGDGYQVTVRGTYRSSGSLLGESVTVPASCATAAAAGVFDTERCWK